MSEIQIFSDGACDINRDISNQNNIEIIPFYVSLNHIDYYKEIEEISLEKFYNEMIENNIFPKTSLPSVQDYINSFEKALKKGKDIICITVTDTLSGSYQSANTAKIMLEEKYKNSKIIIVNSWNTTGCQTIMLLEIVKMIKAGIEIEKIAEICEKMRKDSRIIFVVGTLENLHRGGRIGKVASISGTILNIKPIIVLKNGEISVGAVSRGRKKAIKKITELTFEYFKKENYKDYLFTIGTTNNFDEIEPLKELILQKLPEAEFYDSFRMGAAVGAHTGRDTLGICFIKKYENYL